jgi:uncharacterized membrane protein YagU involved in acid resistance
LNWASWILSGFIATLVLSAALSVTQGPGLTRINLPYVLGTILTPDRDKARRYGFLAHIVGGWAFSIIYILIFEAKHLSNWWFGAVIGLVHALFVLTVGAMLLPTIHPRMATERHGPTARRQLEPPGFMALNYGYQTPLSVFLSHAAFGAILGFLYHLK